MSNKYTLITILIALATDAQAERADPPEFTPEEEAVFFENAHDQLVGPRPEYGAVAPKAPTQKTESGEGRSSVAWSDWVESDRLESEIKRQAKILAQATTSVARFNGGGYREASDSLGMVSVLMAITSEHSEEPRWYDQAASYRDHFADGDGLEADEPSYETAKARAFDLSDLVRGSRPEVADATTEVDWSELATRGGLMRRMAEAQEKRLPEWLIDRRSLRRNSEEVRHEAQMLAVLAEALLRPGAYDGEDQEYQTPALELRQAAEDLDHAAESGDLETAQEALKVIGRACAECHEGYRG